MNPSLFTRRFARPLVFFVLFALLASVGLAKEVMTPEQLLGLKQVREAVISPDGQHIDQISRVLEQLRSDPNSRRIIVSAWNVAELEQMALQPCHALFQFYVAEGRLSCQLYQRSCDVFLGVPFNIASYALLTQMIAQQCDLEIGEFIWTGGDVHLYRNHLEQVRTQLNRTPRALPQLQIKRRPASLFEYQFEDFEILNYDPWPVIKAPIAV